MSKETIKIPDMGGADGVEIIEVCVAVGDIIAAEESLLVLESDKASMEVPAPKAGKVLALHMKVGDSVSEGDAILDLELDADGDEESDQKNAQQSGEADAADRSDEQSGNDSGADADKAQAVPASATNKKSAKSSAGGLQRIELPDVGSDEGVEIIELCVAEGDSIEEGDSLLVLESDKASMEVPSPYSGVIRSFSVKVGDSVGTGSLIGEMEVQGGAAEDDGDEQAAGDAPAEADSETKEATGAAESEARARGGDKNKAVAGNDRDVAPGGFQSANPAASSGPVIGPTVSAHPGVYAGPAVRKLAREFGVALEDVKGSGPKGRVVKEDLQDHVKQLAQGGAGAGNGLPPLPEVDFSRFGAVDIQPRSKLQKLTAANMHRSWVNLPHVTHFDEVDVTELEAFRSSLKVEAERRQLKMTPLPFLLKAAAAALQAHPQFNASLSADGESLVYKQYVHIGIAVATPAGLVVPVIRDVDKKSLWTLAAESAELAQKAKDRKLQATDMQGGCFTISSLGGMGGTGFTPIINAPELAILAVSKLAVKPVWDGDSFQPRQVLPLALSYDHRAINGADAGEFMVFLNRVLADTRRLLL